MNETIVAVLHEHADGDIHIEQLLGAVRAGARRRRRRRLAVVCGSAVLVAGSVSMTAAAPVGGPPTPGLPRPPRVANAPTAATAPEVLGSDPTVFHLDVTGITGWTNLAWSARTRHEELTADLEAGGQVRIAADRDPFPGGAASSKVSVGGQPAEATSSNGAYAVRWQPVPAIWVQVEAPDSLQQAIGIAERVRLDRVYRCAVPFRLPGLTGAHLRKCQTFFLADGGRPGAEVWLTLGSGTTEYEVAVGYNDSPVVPNDRIGDRAVEINPPTRDRPYEVRYAYSGRIAFFWAWSDAPVDAALVIAFTPVDGTDPRTWPANPLED